MIETSNYFALLEELAETKTSSFEYIGLTFIYDYIGYLIYLIYISYVLI